VTFSIEPPSDQPLSAGDLVGRAFRVYRRHLPFFFGILLPPTIVSTVGALGLQWSVTAALAGESGKATPLPVIAGVVVVSLITLLLAKWVLAVRQLAFVRMTNGFAADYREAHAFTHRKRWIIVALYFTSVTFLVAAAIGWSIVVTVAYAIPNVSPGLYLMRMASILVATTGLLFAGIVCVLVTFLVFSIAACEDQSLSGYVSRATSLTMGDLWRSIGFGALMATTLAALSYPLTLPVVLISAFDIFQQGMAASDSMLDSYKMPFYLMVVSQCWESLINMLLWPVIFIAYGYFYYDLRLRQEGLDLARRLEALETPPA